MKNVLKKLYNGLLLFLKTLVSILSVLLFSRRRAVKDIRHLRESSKKSRVIILGNGVSMKDMLENHLEDLYEEDTLVVNSFCRSPYFMKLKPTYYVLLDPLFFNGAHFERIDSQRQELLSILPEVDWEMTMFVPSLFRRSEFTKKLQAMPSINIRFFNMTPVDGVASVNNCLFRHNLGMPTAQNVTCAAVFIMTNLRYNEIYLIGAEHNWLDSFYINDRNQLVMGDKHFYGKEEIVADKTLSTWLEQLMLVFRCHERLAAYARLCGVKIFNATPASHIDAYERASLF